MQKIKAAILGSTGRAGTELQKLLTGHPLVEVVHASSGRARNEGVESGLKPAGIAFLALPTEVSLQWVHYLLSEGKRVIDLSRLYRTDGRVAYGLPEMNRDRIRTAALVSNPGCYATSVILGLMPIRDIAEGIFVAAVSGISGAGEFPKAEDNIIAYKIGREHDHVPEAECALGVPRILFAPKVIEKMDRGLVSTIHACLKEDRPIADAYNARYAHEWFVWVDNEAMDVGTKCLIGRNFCKIRLWQEGKDVIIISALDNLMKGAAGQAVQNMNIMFGLDEAAGLSQ